MTGRDGGVVIDTGSREDVVLQDGSTLRRRPTTPADEAPLVDFFRGLSVESLHLRFQGGVKADNRLVARFLQSDSESLSLVGELAGPEGVSRVDARIRISRSAPVATAKTW